MLKVKKLFGNIIVLYIYISAYTYDKHIDQKNLKIKILQVIKRKKKHHPTCPSD